MSGYVCKKKKELIEELKDGVSLVGECKTDRSPSWGDTLLSVHRAGRHPVRAVVPRCHPHLVWRVEQNFFAVFHR